MRIESSAGVVSKRIIPNAYNPDGLKYWRAALPRAADGCGGVDILWIAHSYGTAATVTNPVHFCYPQILRRKLQARYNPAGVGGMGFINARSVGISSTNWSNYSGGDCTGGSGKRYAGNSVSPRILTLTLNDATAGISPYNPDALPTTLPYCTDLEAVISAGVGTSIMGKWTFGWDIGAGYVDLQTNIDTTAFQGQSGLRACRKLSTADGTSWHHDTLPTTGDMKYSITAVDAAKYNDVCGFVHYRNDWDCGVRLHNFSIAGSYAVGYKLQASPNVGNNGLHDFCSATRCIYPDGTRPTNKFCGLVGIGLGVNEYFRQDTTPDEFYANMASVINAAHTYNPYASILLLADWQITTGTNPLPETHVWREYVDKLYQLVDAYSDYVTLIDMYAWTGNATRAQAYLHHTNCALEGADSMHPSALGQTAYAESIYRLLTD
ncbi:MAG: hypothetical protein ABFD64_02925 [Armatimonadota bacterium]